MSRSLVHHAVSDVKRSAGDVLETGDHPQHRGLAASRWSYEDHQLAIVDREIESVNRLEPVWIDLLYALKRDRRYGNTPPWTPSA